MYFGINLRRLRDHVNSFQTEAAYTTFIEMVNQILARTRTSFDAASADISGIFGNQGLAFEDALSKFEERIKRRQVEHDFEHPLTLHMMVELANFLIIVVEHDLNKPNTQLETAQERLKRAANLLKTSLATVFEEEIVQEFGPRNLRWDQNEEDDSPIHM
ncbi:hypothetical protein DPV78_003796 [Talaromyces pinophilus]|nr:hypothetical protein DPV78_003796 [Talaromyces pinophilus]